MFPITNATKAGIITAVNALMIVLLAFGVPVTQVQIAAIVGLVNALLALGVAMTYKNSPTRKPEA